MRFALLSLLLISCAHGASTATLAVPHCPADGGPAWVELVSPHFRLRTDLPRERAREIVRRFEAQLAPVAAVVDSFMPGSASPGQTDVVVFARDRDFEWFTPDALGVFRVVDDRDTPVIAMAERDATNDTHVIKHELVHRFVYRRLSHWPRWLDEGLAEYAAGNRYQPEHLRRAPPVDWIARADGPTFAASGSYEIGAYVLFRWLADGTPAQHAGLCAFVRDVAAGRVPYDAFVERIGKPAALEPAFRAYVEALAATKPGAATPAPPTPAAASPPGAEIAIEEHAVDEAQLHYLWATLSGRRALMQLDEMRDHAGDSPLLHWLLARIAEGHQDFVTADAELDRAVALAPGEPRWSHERTLIHARRIVYHRVPGTLASLDGELADIALKSDNPRMLNDVAWFYAKSERPALGFPPAMRALAVQPENVNLLDTLAFLYYERGDVAEALRLQEEAYARLSELGGVSQGMADRLQLYREATHAR